MRPQTLRAAPYLLRKIGDIAPKADPSFKTFLDAQLLISAQTTSEHANALYASAALDLPRRGVNHVRGGIGGLAKTLVDWIRARGGEVLYRQRVEAIEVKDGNAVAVRTDKGLRLEGDFVLANLTPWAMTNFPGQSTAGVTLGALRVAADVLTASRPARPTWIRATQQTLYKV